jgi:hypothetical protein
MTSNPDNKHYESDQVRVMLLGTYHMDNPGLNEINVAADDVLAPKRQEELQILTTQLASWQPERIAVERPYDSADAVNTLYNEYRTGERSYNREESIDPPHPYSDDPTTECRSEVVQIGFRLADTLDHERIHPIDHPIDISLPRHRCSVRLILFRIYNYTEAVIERFSRSLFSEQTMTDRTIGSPVY